ncbi:hypothetical protein FH063_006681 [Azospirillum argentinense]|uniref:Caspase domain-containing protein n=1 Tax=Azospirillum argentinense TaxID=2970906 RepID=A0A5B0KR79_9PROT|nr:hypothetical protein FH063_006681 [Azospirillum argentinense]
MGEGDVDALNLAVVESRWWKTGNCTVKGMFDILAEIQTGSPVNYHYEMFNNTASLREIMGRLAADRKITNVYIASHGDKTGISGAAGNDDNFIPRNALGKLLKEATASRTGGLKGIYFGCCLVGNAKTARALLTPPDGNDMGVRWVAGYVEEVGWVASSAIDIFFWNRYYEVSRKHEERRRKALKKGIAIRLHEAKKVQQVARFMRRFMPGAFRNLGLRVYIRDRAANVVEIGPP